MNLVKSWIKLDVDGQAAQGYIAKPALAKSALPGIVVIQEAFGVDEFIQDIVERLATAGYVALAPDLFSYGGKPAPLFPERIEEAKNFLDTIPTTAWFDVAQRDQELAKLDEAPRNRLKETFALLLTQTRPWDQYLATLRAGRAYLQHNDAHGARIGSIGFCLGGALSMRLACSDTELAAAVAFYGFAPSADEIKRATAPILALYAEDDPRINAGITALGEAMRAANKRFAAHTYPGTRHAFMNDTRGNWNVDAARHAWAKALSFFAEELAPLRPQAAS